VSKCGREITPTAVGRRPERRPEWRSSMMYVFLSHCSVYSLFARDKHRSETNPGRGLLSQSVEISRDLTRVRDVRAYDEKPDLTNGDITDAQDTHS